MLTSYVNWQFVLGPKWLLRLFLNIQRVLFRLFSVHYMIKTLFFHWHRDAVKYQGGTLSKYMMIFAWNSISRCIGFVVRSIVLVAWIGTELVYIPLAAIVFIIFILWPIIVLLFISFSLSLIII